MSGRHCAVVGCANGDYRLNRWRQTYCEKHGCNFDVGSCTCHAPFELFQFPKSDTDADGRRRWKKLVNRKNTAGGMKNWSPGKHHRICSVHFVNGQPTSEHPDPELCLGYDSASKKSRRPPPLRTSPMPKRRRLDVETSIAPTCSDYGQSINLLPDESLNEGGTMLSSAKHTASDHTYTTAPPVRDCPSCCDKDRLIARLQAKIALLEYQASTAGKTVATKSDVSLQFVKSDRLVKQNTGLANTESLNSLFNYVEPKAAKMRYWVGKKRTVICHKRGKSAAKKTGKRRQLTMKAELIMVLMKIRLGLTNAFLSCLFDISVGSCSSILNTWIKFLSFHLKPLVFWPDRETTNKLVPKSLKVKYPKLRCTLDCSETFIHRPRDLYLQATTWSDYKHHNTVKYLVAIAPNGHISFISGSWGGRATDRHIVQQSGILSLIDPGDVILADRGFTIQEDLLFRQATLVIPPPGSGKCQMTTQNVIKTRRIANARIHVERAINRLKWFNLLSTTLPVTMVPLVDDLLIICAALCNLLPPLVKQ